MGIEWRLRPLRTRSTCLRHAPVGSCMLADVPMYLPFVGAL